MLWWQFVVVSVGNTLAGLLNSGWRTWRCFIAKRISSFCFVLPKKVVGARHWQQTTDLQTLLRTRCCTLRQIEAIITIITTSSKAAQSTRKSRTKSKFELNKKRFNFNLNDSISIICLPKREEAQRNKYINTYVYAYRVCRKRKRFKSHAQLAKIIAI